MSNDPGRAELRAENVCAIAVTYEPDDEAVRCVARLGQFTAATVVVDNNSSEERFSRLRAADSRLAFVRNAENAGVAAGLNVGIAEARRRGFQWFLLFDQDTEIDATMVERVVEAYRSCPYGNRIALQGARFATRRADGSIESPPPVTGALWRETDLVITSGTLIGAAAFDAIGPFREDFFIDFVDYEYCLRARRQGFAVIQTAQPVMVHRPGNITRVDSLLTLGKRRFVSNYSPLRRYYSTRNLMLLQREYGAAYPDLIGRLSKELRHDVRIIVKYEADKWAKLKAMVEGYRDGRAGRSGKRGGGPGLG